MQQNIKKTRADGRLGRPEFIHDKDGRLCFVLMHADPEAHQPGLKGS
jgi:hypothetical protein